jgi:hypothetical protein
MTVVEIVSYVVAALIAFSRILKSTEPFWKLLPPKVALFIPSIVAMVPVLIEQVGGAKTTLDLVNALLVAGALLLPGAGVSAAQSTDKPKEE